jgi:uncharacterized protein with NRDE domain
VENAPWPESDAAMCLLVIALKIHPGYKLVLAANRDEFHDRPTAPAHYWEEAPQMLAGKDLRGGGTWLGMTKRGRIAGVTNYRNPAFRLEAAPSRGRLVSDFLMEEQEIEAYCRDLFRKGPSYNGFNLVFGDVDGICWYSNRGKAPRRLSPGLYGLSNHLLDTPWPKVKRAKEGVAACLSGKTPDPEALFRVLGEEGIPPDEDLPDTGVGIERERLLSPLFINNPIYGTRSSTILLVDRRNRASFLERSFGPSRGDVKNVSYTFQIPP